jgi:hypothetical protein
MDKMMMVELGGMKDMPDSNKAVESETKCIKKEFEDGSYEEVKVEKVEGGYIKKVCKRFKDSEGCWQYSEEKSVHTEDPLEEKSSIADRLESVLKGLM